MKRTVKITLAVVGVAVAAILVTFVAVTMRIRAELRRIREMPIADLDVSAVPDGVHRGDDHLQGPDESRRKRANRRGCETYLE